MELPHESRPKGQPPPGAGMGAGLRRYMAQLVAEEAERKLEAVSQLATAMAVAGEYLGCGGGGGVPLLW